jgi:hypothetical protein
LRDIAHKKHGRFLFFRSREMEVPEGLQNREEKLTSVNST